MQTTAPLGVLGFWTQTDTIGKSAAVLLLVMSLLTWYLIFGKGWQTWRTGRRAQRAMRAFWEGEGLAEAVARALTPAGVRAA